MAKFIPNIKRNRPSGLRKAQPRQKDEQIFN